MKTELHTMIENARKLATSTREAYLRDVDRFIAFVGADPSGWTVESARAYYASLLEGDRMAPQSANRYMAGVAFAARRRADERSDPRLNFMTPLRDERASGDPPEKRKPLTEEQARAIVEACLDQKTPWNLRDTALVVVELETGMRLMSIRSMLWEEITKSEFGYPIARVLIKGRKKHRFDVPLSDTAMLALERWGVWCARHRANGPVFATLGREIKPGGVLSDSAIQKIIDERASAASLRRNVHPHIFRHTFVKWRRDAGLSFEDLSVMTGHKVTSDAIGGYYDMRDRGNRIRNATPVWLARLIGGG